MSHFSTSTLLVSLYNDPDLQWTRYISNIEMAGGIIRYVPLQPPKDGDTRTSSAAEWAIDMEALERAMNPKTKMIVREMSFL